jgi:hypothetical protein
MKHFIIFPPKSKMSFDCVFGCYPKTTNNAANSQKHDPRDCDTFFVLLGNFLLDSLRRPEISCRQLSKAEFYTRA